MATTDIDICSRALVMIGANPITSFEEETDEAKACAILYEGTLKNQIALHPWRFTMGYKVLSRLTAAPSGKWDAAYQIPDTPQVIRVHSCYVNSHPIEFDVFEDNLYCNAAASETVELEASFLIAEEHFPEYFTRLLELWMAAYLAESLAAKPELADRFEQKAEKQFARAKNIDSQGRTPSKFYTGRVISRRYRTTIADRMRDY